MAVLLQFLLPMTANGAPYYARAKINQDSSTNWAGYAADTGKYTEVSGTWQIPKITASKSFTMDATWIGIGGANSDDLIQSGTQAVSQNNKVTYQAWIEMLPAGSKPLSVDVNAGDSVSVDISMESKNKWLIAFTDNTSGKTVSKEENYSSSLSSAEWIEEAPSDNYGVLPLDDFGSVKFSNSYAVKDGKKLSAGDCRASAINLVGDSGNVLASTGSLSSNGTSFVVNRSSNKQSIPKNRTFSPMDTWTHPGHRKTYNKK
jgi:hypothetical protein